MKTRASANRREEVVAYRVFDPYNGRDFVTHTRYDVGASVNVASDD
jgi:hypothetical protein